MTKILFQRFDLGRQTRWKLKKWFFKEPITFYSYLSFQIFVGNLTGFFHIQMFLRQNGWDFCRNWRNLAFSFADYLTDMFVLGEILVPGRWTLFWLLKAVPGKIFGPWKINHENRLTTHLYIFQMDEEKLNHPIYHRWFRIQIFTKIV